eukprot:UN10820
MSGMMIPNDDPSNINSFYSGGINIFFPYLNQMKNVGGGMWGRGGGGGGSEGTLNDPDGNGSFEESRASYASYSIGQYVPSGYGRGDTKPLKKVFRPFSSLKVFPIGLVKAPVTLKDVKSGNEYKLKFAAGFIGVEQNKKTLEVCPKIGWFIAEK